jgi:sulfoxide reductase catalytic subunit YedY
MVIPWIGFSMKSLLAAVEPTSQAKFVSFSSYYNQKITVGPYGHWVESCPGPIQKD